MILTTISFTTMTRVSCAVGLLNIQTYSGLDPADLIKGEIIDPASGENFQNIQTEIALSGETFKAATQLTPRDAELVAKVLFS